MNLSFVRKHRFAVAVGAAAVAMIVVAGLSDVVVASNMGFKMNRQILVGNNIVSLPYKTPIATAKDLCNVFGKSTAQTAVTQFYPGNGATQAFTCDQGTSGFAVQSKGFGLLVAESGSAASGIVVGSHIPGQSVTIPGGSNFLYAYPYHTTNANAKDICNEFGLTNTAGSAAAMTRIAGGTSSAFTCDQGTSGFALVLGEGVLIQNENNGPKMAVPSHF